MTAQARYLDTRISGDRWLGQVPSHWSTPSLGQSVRIRNGADYKEVITDSEDGVPVIGSGGEFARATRALFDGKSVLLGRKGTIDRPLFWDGPFWTVDTMFYTEIGPDLDARYFYYFATQINFGFYSTNTALPSMASSDLRAIRLSMPPMSEQLQIASYLDRETGQIDALITKQEQLVATLTERRQTVITQAVTRGLDPEVKLKGSGSEWWDRIPVTWTVRRIKHVVETPITDGPHTTPEFLDEGVEFISAEAISAGVVNFDKRRGFISRTDNLSYSAKYSPKLHDIYMIKSGATTGVSAILTEMREFNIWSPLAVIRANSSVDPFFLHYAIRSAPFQRAVSQTWTYGTQQNIGMKSIGELAVPSPTLPEQKAIVAFLDASTLHADRLVQLAKDSIALLRERRQALISAAVTGKIDVRGL